MSTLTIRDMDEMVQERLRQQAAVRGISVEAEVRRILTEATDVPKKNFLLTLRELIQDNGADLTPHLPSRNEPPREVDFG